MNGNVKLYAIDGRERTFDNASEIQQKEGGVVSFKHGGKYYHATVPYIVEEKR